MSLLVFLIGILIIFHSIHIVAVNGLANVPLHIDDIEWREFTSMPFDMADCRAAMNMIPDGKIEFDGKVPERHQTLQFFLPDKARNRARWPAKFRSGNCQISTGIMEYSDFEPPDNRYRFWQQPPHRVRKPASLFYYKLWPSVRETARRILEECPHTASAQGWLGFAKFTIVVDGNRFKSDVYVTRIEPRPIVPPPKPRKQRKQRKRPYFKEINHQYHAYQADEQGRNVLTSPYQ